VVVPDDQQGFARALELVVLNPLDAWTSVGEHQLTIVNPDGQKAVLKFEVPAKPGVVTGSRDDHAAPDRTTPSSATQADVSQEKVTVTGIVPAQPHDENAPHPDEPAPGT
jgi:hypothetical protein